MDKDITLEQQMDEVLNSFDERKKRIQVDSKYLNACDLLEAQGIIIVNSRDGNIDIVITNKGEVFKSKGGYAEQRRKRRRERFSNIWSTLNNQASFATALLALILAIISLLN